MGIRLNGQNGPYNGIPDADFRVFNAQGKAPSRAW
jgi:hypothetical protein